MKNLKKVLALVVALTMVLGTVSFAFTDVDSDSDVYTAVQTLSSLNILNGYEDGTFGAEKDITRAEFAAVVCRALGMESSAKGAAGATQFTDVAADHWASGYINLAAGQGIVNGYGDGKFGPEDNVTYEQAVKMLVVALGFEPMAAQKGGYPTGYLVIANQYGMTKGVSAQGASANRGTVAQLTFNALDIPMMTQTGWGTNTEYTVQDGQNNNGYKTLLTVLEVEKLDGIVTATPTIGGSTTDEKITYKITNIDAEKSAFLNAAGIIINSANNLYVGEGINVNDYFGMASTVYAKEFKKGRFEIIAIMPGEASETVEFLAEDIDTVSATEIKYFESDAATKATKLDLAAGINTAVYLNNKLVTVTNLNTTLTSWAGDTVITLYENDDTAPGYDMIVAKRYTHDIVKEVEVAKDRIELKINGTFRFDFEDSAKINNIYDKDGNEITLEDFAEGDVIAYITEDGTRNGFDWCEVINLGQNKVTGTVTELNTNNNTVAIDGVVYDYESGMSIATSDEGDFYLRLDGTIFLKDTTASISSNYAYILDAEWNANDVFNPGWQIKLLTKNDGIQVYSMKDSFTVTDLTGTKTTHSKSSNVPSTTVPAQFAAAKVDCDTSTTEDAEERLVTFKLDSNNTIKDITFIATSGSEQFLTTAVKYQDAAQKINGRFIADNAVVFNVADVSADNAEVLTVDSLVDKAEYKGLVAKVDASETEYNCVVLTYGAANVDYTQPIAVVSAVGTSVDADGADITKITYYTTDDAEAKELVIDDDTTVAPGAHSFAKGDIIMFTANDKGVASYVDVLAKVSSDVYVLNNTEVTNAIQKENDNEFIVGYINDMRTGSNGKVVEYAGATHKYYNGGSVVSGSATGDVVITSDVYGFTYVNNQAGTRGYIAADDWSADPDIDKPNGALKTYFFARVLDGVLTDIVVLGDQK